MSLQGHYLCKFLALYIIIINRMVACAHRVALAALRGGQAASAESCTHPAKRDHRFPPPIAERQRLPNVRIGDLVLCYKPKLIIFVCSLLMGIKILLISLWPTDVTWRQRSVKSII